MSGSEICRRALLVGASAVALIALLTGCPRHGMVGDGTTVSWGTAGEGMLVNPARLPSEGDGYWIPPRWDRRGLNYGTDELVRLIAHVGRVMRAEYPDALVGVADLSWPTGGPSAWHQTHQTGRDVDLLFFARDRRGRVVHSKYMRRFGPDGVTLPTRGKSGKRHRTLYFDIERNWRMIRAVLENPIVRVQRIYVYEPLKQLLLDHAEEIGESPLIVAYARHIMEEPEFALPHDDHFHVRIYCPPTDVPHGCRDYGDQRWNRWAGELSYVRARIMDWLLALSVPRMATTLSVGFIPLRGFIAR